MSNISEIYARVQVALEALLSQEDLKSLFTECDLPFIKLFFKQGMIVEEDFTLLAAQYGHVEALLWAPARGHPFNLPRFIRTRQEKEDLGIIDIICKTRELTDEDLDLAVAHDKPLLVAKILERQKKEWSNRLTVQALKAGAWDVLKSFYVIDQFKDFPLPAEPVPAVPRLPGMPDLPGRLGTPGMLEMPELHKVHQAIRDWICSHGVPNSLNAHQIAAQGRLDVLKWFFPGAKGCGLNVWSMALVNDHIDIMHWLYQSRPTNPVFSKGMLLDVAKKLGRDDILAAYTDQ